MVIREVRHKNANMVGIYFGGENFYPILNEVKRTELREYGGAKKKVWLVPFNSVGDLINRIHNKVKNETIIWNNYFVKSNYKHDRKRKIMLNIRKIPIEVSFDFYNKYMHNDYTLSPYQTIGAHFLYKGKNALLADVVGLGKTPQSIIAAERLMQEDSFYNTIVIVPASLKKKWANDIDKFLGKGRYIMVDGKKDIRRAQYKEILEKNIFLIINYDLAIHDWEEEFFPILEQDRDKKRVIIFDEIQYLKNHKAKRSKLSLELSLFCEAKFGLSATYLETSLMDVFNITMVIDPDIFGYNQNRFFYNYIKFDYFGKEIGHKNLDSVIDKTKHIKLRRQKEQVFEQLPEREETVYWCKLDKYQWQCYKDVEANVIERIKDKQRQQQVSTAEVLTQIQYLIQACLSSELMGYEKHSSSKLNMLFDVFEQIGNEKIIIFCFYKKMLDIIEREMMKKGYRVLCAHGGKGLSATQRQDMIDQFNTDKNINALLTSDIFKQGVDLIGASTLINFDIRWNPAVIEQRNGRIDRIGQKAGKINIQYFLTEGTIEERIWEVFYDRKKLMKEVVDEGFNSKRVQLKQLMHLIKGD